MDFLLSPETISSKMKNVLVLLALALICSCQSNQPAENSQEIPRQEPVTSHHSANITKVFDAHGGFAAWSEMKNLSYVKRGEETVVNLQNRKIRLVSERRTIGYDGENVWVMPDTIEVGNARFYHNLYFYFYSFPFVIGDPGVFYEDLESKEILGKEYNGIKITYGDGVGDTPKDYYIVWYDPQTYKMEWLMYTVTFRSGERNENYRLINYDQWQEIEGLLLPTSIQWYNYKDGVIGDKGNNVVFEDVKISKQMPSDDLFAMPEGAQLAPMPSPK